MQWNTLQTDETKKNFALFGTDVHMMMNNVLFMTKNCINQCDKNTKVLKEGFIENDSTKKCIDECFIGYVKSKKISLELFDQLNQINDADA